MKNLFFIGAVLTMLTLWSCKGNDPVTPSDGEQYDKESMLQSIAEDQVLTALESTLLSATSFDAALAALKEDPSEANHEALKAALLEFYTAWQFCAPFDFGPAADAGMKRLVNTFPADTARIGSLLTSEGYDLYSAQNTAAKGLPALEYIVFSYDTEDIASEAVMDFLEANSTLCQDAVSSVKDTWDATYKEEFKTSTGSDVGSSLGLMVNALNQDFELIKNAKVGIPLGKKSLGVAQPEKVEALYSGSSLELCASNLAAVRAIIEGKSDGQGLGDYLDALQAKYNDQDLSEAIIHGFDEAEEALSQIPGPLNQAIESDPSSVDNLHGKLQNLVILLKTDMPSQMGIQITYQDNDGD